jgi:hypothetical protein
MPDTAAHTNGIFVSNGIELSRNGGGPLIGLALNTLSLIRRIYRLRRRPNPVRQS